MKNIKKIAIFLLLILLILSSCGKKEEAAVENSEPVLNPKLQEPLPTKAPVDVAPVTQAPVEEPKKEEVLYRNPLNGSPVESDISNQRPYAIMINNHKLAQPTISLSSADIIYEYIAEGGITRLMAFYQSVEGIGEIGTVRSLRPYYLETAMGYDAIVVHAGGSEEAYSDLASWKIDNLDGVRGGKDALIFWRDAWRKENRGYEHSLLTSGEKILAFMESSNMRKTHKEGSNYALSFTEESEAGSGSDAKKISVKFSSYKTGIYEYDETEKKYKVSQYGSAMKDGSKGPQLCVKNVLVLNTSSKILDDYGRMSFATTGSGRGNYYCEGKCIPITWSRNSRNDAYVYTKEDGTPLKFMVGNSYICVINPKNSSESIDIE